MSGSRGDTAHVSLRDGVHAVAIGEDVVFLDVRDDRYVCLPGGARAMTLQPQGPLILSDPALSADLEAAELIIRGSSRRTALAWPPLLPPRAGATDLVAEAPVWRDAWAAIPTLSDALCFYWRRPFRSLVAQASAGVTEHGQRDHPPSEALLSRVRQFHRWVPYAPTSGKCLLRSFMLLCWLRRHGEDARWVFGVSTWPFRAHCWLQFGEVVLDDHPETIAALVPILVVG